MQLKHARIAAFVAVATMPLLSILFNAVDFRVEPGEFASDHCVMRPHESVWLLMLFAACLAATRNPFRAWVACLAYLPVGSLFAMEPCTLPRSQLSGGLIYVISPVFVLFVVIAAFVGGAILRWIFSLASRARTKTELP